MEELDFQGLLDHFREKGFQKGEQVILGNFGTVQTLLSLIFETPVNVCDIKMEEKNGDIIRMVNLKAGPGLFRHLRSHGWEPAGQLLVAQATSRIPIDRNSFDVLHSITSGKLGLGQIVVTYQIPNRRILQEVGRNKEAFWRTYTIEGPDLFLEIHEHFPREPFEKVGWIGIEPGKVVHLRSPRVKKIP